MRAYFFGNMYLSSIQQGIQGEHAMTAMFVKYRHQKDHLDTLYEWAENHKTSIYLNGGYADNLLRVHNEIDDIERHLAEHLVADPDYLKSIGLSSDFSLDESIFRLSHSLFHEEQASLNGALTSVAVILPECFYFRNEATMKDIDSKLAEGCSLFPHERMLKLLSEFRLAS
ncbi:MAG: hypothetical protein EPN31_15635 [Castellaniella sp.]|uniref:hypothetical protein n=1 Tax=Castellaniella sp. TaxID=1955812 RepID=UPI00121F6CBE|nr:hypothetical protein [Castellaniella sp.]TAN25290.1 MAG: hypothetical protein EPN31_15635 [Castellaniella sp.]